MEFATKNGIFHIVCEFQTIRIIDIELRSTVSGKCQRGLGRRSSLKIISIQMLSTQLKKKKEFLTVSHVKFFSERNQGFSIDYIL